LRRQHRTCIARRWQYWGNNMSVEETIRTKLTEAFAPSELDVINDSHRHAGHAGSPGTGSSHFNVRIVSAAFDDLSRVDRQRKVYEVLKDELAGPVHALALTASGAAKR